MSYKVTLKTFQNCFSAELSDLSLSTPQKCLWLHCSLRFLGPGGGEQMDTHTPYVEMFQNYTKLTNYWVKYALSSYLGPYDFSSVQLLSCVWLFVTPWITAHQASQFIDNSYSLLKLMSMESVMPSNHLILCHPLLLLPSIFPSIRVFCNKSALHIRWPKYWIFRFSIIPSKEHPGLISFRMDWLDLLAVQRTLKSLL